MQYMGCDPSLIPDRRRLYQSNPTNESIRCQWMSHTNNTSHGSVSPFRSVMNTVQGLHPSQLDSNFRGVRTYFCGSLKFVTSLLASIQEVKLCQLNRQPEVTFINYRVKVQIQVKINSQKWQSHSSHQKSRPSEIIIISTTTTNRPRIHHPHRQTGGQ